MGGGEGWVPQTSCQSSLAELGPTGCESEDQDSISELDRWRSS